MPLYLLSRAGWGFRYTRLRSFANRKRIRIDIKKYNSQNNPCPRGRSDLRAQICLRLSPKHVDWTPFNSNPNQTFSRLTRFIPLSSTPHCPSYICYLKINIFFFWCYIMALFTGQLETASHVTSQAKHGEAIFFPSSFFTFHSQLG